jgi:hypothetical protein
MKPMPTAKKARSSIKRDTVNPSDYLKYHHCFSCEDCVHFKVSDATCTIGYRTQWHRKEFQTQEYERTGRLAHCRFLEID